MVIILAPPVQLWGLQTQPQMITEIIIALSLMDAENSFKVLQPILSVPVVTFGYKYYVDITIDQAAGSEDLADFPVLINITQDYLRSIANGGHVENINGYDILFTDLSGSKLNHQVEAYYPVSGNLVAWVRVPILSGSGTTVVRMVYGNQAVTTDQSVESTWISSYKGVWHLSNDVLLDANII